VIETRLRTKIPESELREKVGKILTDDDYNMLVTRATAVFKPDGKLLLKYLPGTFSAERMASFYEVLHSLKQYETTNRGLASGTERKKNFEESTWTYSKSVPSAIIGAFDAKPPKNYCRLTAWSGREMDKFSSLFPLFEDIGRSFAEHVPDRYAAQMEYVGETKEDWLIPRTPFTTITVNNTYPTGVHTDKGDLDSGFSNLCVLRRGAYRGGRLVFPEYRVAVDMQDGDLLLMDAHEWHGNTTLELLDPPCYVCDQRATRRVTGTLAGYASARTWTFCDEHAAFAKRQPNFTLAEDRDEVITPAERISIVCYYRTKMKECGDADEEAKRAEAWAERRIAIGEAAVEEMAEEAVGA
jgi:hypothetical protein